jgi:hypothetical protein
MEIKGKVIIEKQQSIKKLVLYNKITKKEEELINSLIKKYNVYTYIIGKNIYIVEHQHSKFAKDIQNKLINEYKYQQNNNIYSKRI